MNPSQPDPNDPTFLFSRGLDEELTADERRKLDEALANSPTLRAEAERLRSVDQLVRGWAAASADVDWTHHRDLVQANVEAGGENDALARLDQLLRRYGQEPPAMDPAEYTAVVMARVRTAEALGARRSRLSWILRVGTPLAAAAAIAVTFVTAPWQARDGRVVVTFGDRPEARGSDPLADRSLVAFDRTAPSGSPVASGSSGVSIGAMGPSAWGEVADDDVPL